MSNGELQKDGTTPQKPAQPSPESKPAGAGKVELSDEQYNALLDRIAELETIATAKPRSNRSDATDLETLAAEGGPARREAAKPQPAENIKDLDDMSNTELVNTILSEIDRAGGERLGKVEVAVETLR